MKPDSQLVELSLKHDRNAFRLIVEKTQDMTYQVANRFLRTPNEAEDAVQEVYVRLWKNLHKYRPEIKLSTWIYRITVNYCLDILKSRSYRQSELSKSVEKLSLQVSQETDKELERYETHELVMRAADRLTPVQKAVFILRDLEGLSPDETCNALAMSSDTVKSNLYHARKRMAELLKPFKDILL